MKSILRIALLLMISAGAVAVKPLQNGAFTVGGSARLPIKWDTFGNVVVGVDASPSGSYFFADQWELNASLRIRGTAYQSPSLRSQRTPIFYGVELGVNYYFDFDIGFFPYLGVSLGGAIGDFKLQTTQLYVEVPLGVAFTVSENLMIQVGAPVKFLLHPPGPTLGTAFIEWTPAFVGARIFL
jgi:hypothetical protein